MGRTSRRRRSKKKFSLSQTKNKDEIILNRLFAWMRSLNWSPTCSLDCYRFPDTGRGLKALKYVESNEIIVKIPKNLLITTSVISQSSIQHIISNPEISDAQGALAAFLVYEVHLGDESAWKPYLDSIPQAFNNPYFCTTREKENLPSYLLDMLNIQSAKIKSTYLALRTALKNTFKHCIGNDFFSPRMEECPHCNLLYENIITFAKYQWAYFVINTRAVYIDQQEEQVKFRNNNLALAPFLDLFNHSFDAAVSTGLIKDQTHAEFYHITTLKSFEEGSQVFINYGPHDNAKLYIEYGFFIPNNPLDEIFFDISDVNRCITLSDVQQNFIQTSGFNKKMGFNSNGLNYNGKMALFIAVTKFKRKDWLIKIYGNKIDGDLLTDILLLGKKILKLKQTELLEQLSKMEKLEKPSDSFKIAVELVKENIHLLEFSITNLCRSLTV